MFQVKAVGHNEINVLYPVTCFYEINGLFRNRKKKISNFGI